jgi:PAS domain S-box-containing protein
MPKGSPGASADRFQILIESVKDYAIFLVDPDGRVQTWNRGAEIIKGYTADEIIGRSISLFYTPEEQRAGRWRHLLDIALAEGRVEDEGWRVRKDGVRFWADVVITALYDESGTHTGFAKVTRDLTERRMAEETLRSSELRFRLLIEGVKDYAIFMVDPDGRVATWNGGAERIHGYRADEIIGQHLSRFYSEEEVQAGKHDIELRTAEQDGRFEEEGWRLRKDGTRFWADVTLTALRDETGILRGFAKVTRDLTERRKLEEERIRLAQARESIRQRDEFLSIASHELKTPLTALQLQLQSLKLRLGSLDANLARKVERATRSCDRLAGLIETLLDVSRISSGRVPLDRQDFELTDAAQHVIDELRDPAQSVGSSISLHSVGKIVGHWDRVRIEQILTNLLSNAVKYAPGTPIEIWIRREGDDALIEVSDRGPGILEQDLGRIFERFERGASVRNYGGLGLGLYVTREIVHAHGGMVMARNRPGGGATFVVRLPLAHAGAEKAPPARSIHEGSFQDP